MNREVVFVSTDVANTAEFDRICAARGVPVVPVLSLVQIQPDGQRPVVYDLTQMFPDERELVVEQLKGNCPPRPTAVYQKYLDESTALAMQQRGVLVSDKLDESLLAIVPGLATERRQAA